MSSFSPITSLSMSSTSPLIKRAVMNSPAGLFPGKSAVTIFNNKTELFEKAKGQGPGVFKLLGSRFLGYERPLEMLK